MAEGLLGGVNVTVGVGVAVVAVGVGVVGWPPNVGKPDGRPPFLVLVGFGAGMQLTVTPGNLRPWPLPPCWTVVQLVFFFFFTGSLPTWFQAWPLNTTGFEVEKYSCGRFWNTASAKEFQIFAGQ